MSNRVPMVIADGWRVDPASYMSFTYSLGGWSCHAMKWTICLLVRLGIFASLMQSMVGLLQQRLWQHSQTRSPQVRPHVPIIS